MHLCLMLVQLSYMAIPSSDKDTLIPTEFQAGEREHQKCYLFLLLISSAYFRLASFSGGRGYWCILGKKGRASVSRDRQKLWGWSERGERGTARHNFHTSTESIQRTGRTFSLPSSCLWYLFSRSYPGYPGPSSPAPVQPGWPPQAPYLSAENSQSGSG